MPGKSMPYCPLKFNSSTITQDGFVRKTTCECDETLCGWWHTEKNCCVMMTLAEGVDVASEIRKLEKVKLQLMLSSGEDKEAMQVVLKAHPYLKLAQDTGELLR